MIGRSGIKIRMKKGCGGDLFCLYFLLAPLRSYDLSIGRTQKSLSRQEQYNPRQEGEHEIAESGQEESPLAEGERRHFPQCCQQETRDGLRAYERHADTPIRHTRLYERVPLRHSL